LSSNNWRSPAAHRDALHLDPAELAWEFLRRNPDYQASFVEGQMQSDRRTDGPARRWGLRFLADPTQDSSATPVFWHPEELASVIILAPAPARVGLEAFVVDNWLKRFPSHHGEDGTHVLLKDAGIRHQILLTTPPKDGMARVALIPLDPGTPQRARATHKFWDYAARDHPRPRFVGASQLDRLEIALRALDLRQSGASYRTIAEGLFGPKPKDITPWKTAAVRDTVIRLVRTGLFMMRGGYRRLLGPRKPDTPPEAPTPE
jgi:hypothetical protein